MKALLIAEKPSLARDIKSVYETMKFADEITFISLRGHVLELQMPEEYQSDWGKPWRLEVLPMIPEQFKYNVKVKDVFALAKSEITSGKYDYIINACDAGREGELIFYSVYKHIGSKIPVKRFWASDTTPETVKKALENLIDDKDSSLTALKASAQFRSYFDWLLGMNLSRAITLKTNTLIPVGRVMTPTLGIIVQRELEILNFKPLDYWEFEANFGKYKGIWFDKETDETKILDKARAEALKKNLSKEGTVASIEQKKEINYAPTLHSLLELQKEANTAYGYTADKTLEIAQTLYEKRKLLSYPRTESRFLPRNLANEIPKHLKAIEEVAEVSSYVKGILSDKKRIDNIVANKKYVDDKKVTDHHAIIPTIMKPKLSELSKEELNVYMLVVKRFVSIFLDPFVVNKTTIITKVDVENFKTTGKTLVDLGYKAIYGTDSKDDIIPDVKKGEKLAVKDFTIFTKQTSPPQRYNDSTLLQAMQNAGKFIDDKELQMVLKESAGLGTSATRAEVMKKLVEREMIVRKGKVIFPTDFGMKVIDILKNQDIVSPELTAVWEKKLSDIEAGNYDIRAFYAEMKEYAKDSVARYIAEITTLFSSNPKAEVIGKCPKCGAAVVIGNKYYLCQHYKSKDESVACTFVVGKVMNGAKIGKTEIKKLLEGKETKELEFTWKNGTNGKAKLIVGKTGSVEIVRAGKSAEATSNLSNKEAPEAIGKCPSCGKDVLDKQNYYMCESYKKDCEFIIAKNMWGAPISVNEAKELIAGKQLPPKVFTWKSGKSSAASVIYRNGKIELEFTK